jgi:hypothetical protein
VARRRVGFVTGSGSPWRRLMLTARQQALQASGVVLPDIYALPRFLDADVTFIRDGERPARGDVDMIFAELNGAEDQLAHLQTLVAAQPPPVAIVPGPPEILAPRLTDRKLRLVRTVLRDAAHVLAYSADIASFYDGLMGARRAAVIPWPFDYAAVRRLVGGRRPAGAPVRVLLSVPLRFHGDTPNFPFVLKAALLDAMEALPAALRDRVSFHTFTYADEDRATFEASGFADGLPLRLERKRHFRSFIRFLDGCDAVVNLTASSILGRVTFLAAALDKPGLFSPNAAINRELYPHATVPLLDPGQLRCHLTELLRSVTEGEAPARFLPDVDAARRIGDFDANARRFASLVAVT